MLIDVFTEFVDKLFKAQINLQRPFHCSDYYYNYLITTIIIYFNSCKVEGCPNM